MLPAPLPAPHEPFGPVMAFPDAARRMSDTVNMHLAAGSVAKWAAFKLADGTSDNTAYDSRADAIRHQFREDLCTYVLIQPGGMQPREADAVLRFTRWAYDQGYRITSPEDPHPVMPLQMQDLNQLTQTKGRL